MKKLLSKNLPFLTFLSAGLVLYAEDGHWLNIFLHIGSVTLLWWLIQLMLDLPRCRNTRLGERRRRAAFLGAVVFLLYPLQIDVMMPVFQPIFLIIFFLLAAASHYLKGYLTSFRVKWHVAGASLALMLAVLTLWTLL